MIAQYFPNIKAQLMIYIFDQELYPKKLAYHKHESVTNHEETYHYTKTKQTKTNQNRVSRFHRRRGYEEKEIFPTVNIQNMSKEGI